MPSPDLKPIMDLRGRRGPSGRLWLEAERSGRRFVVFETADGSWRMFERVDHPGAETGARSSAPPRRTSRHAPRRVRRELVALGLVEAGDVVREATR